MMQQNCSFLECMESTNNKTGAVKKECSLNNITLKMPISWVLLNVTLPAVFFSVHFLCLLQ